MFIAHFMHDPIGLLAAFGSGLIVGAAAMRVWIFQRERQ